MKYQINNKIKKAAYLQLYEMIRKDIIDGIYGYNDKLPSKRCIASDAQISVLTVAHAYELLSDEGYVTAREKSGYYVSYQSGDFYEAKQAANTRIEKLPTFAENKPYIHGAGELSYNTISKTMRKTLLDYGERILERSENQGIESLRQEICLYLARNIGINAEPNQVVIGAGSEYLYSLVAQLFDDIKYVAVENPCYEKINKVYERFGYRIDKLSLGNDGIKSEELSGSSAGLLHVTPFHSYPSNVSATISKKNEYLKWSSNGRFIIEDNYDSELTVSKKMEDSLFSLSEGDNVIYINTFSRTIAPSLRAGYMILPQRLVQTFNEKLGFYSCTVPAFEQFVLCELLSSGDFERHINRVRRRLRKG